MSHFLLDVHCQHLATEGQALGLLDHLLVRRHCVVAHHHMTLTNTFTNVYFPYLKMHRQINPDRLWMLASVPHKQDKYIDVAVYTTQISSLVRAVYARLRVLKPV